MNSRFHRGYGKGFSLVEILLVVGAIFCLGLLVAALPPAISSVNRSRHTSLAKEAASKQLNSLRQQGFANLSNGSGNFSSSALSSLNEVTAVYTIEDCSPEICSHEEKTKKVMVRISWQESGDAKKVELSTLISEGGL